MGAFLSSGTFISNINQIGSGILTVNEVGTNTLAAKATSITVSGLDLDTDSVYLVRGTIMNGGTSDYSSIFFNADTTATNYHHQRDSATGSTAQGERRNDSRIFFSGTTRQSTFEGTMMRSADGKVKMILAINDSATTDIQIKNVALEWITTSTNVTGITITNGTATNLDVGSKLSVYKYTV